MTTRTLALIAIFTSLILASDYVLSPIFNVKLLDTIVFVATYTFGFRIGTSIAVLSEFIWGTVNPNGFGGLVIPFLILGEMIYVVAGYLASKTWKIDEISALSARNVFFGSTLAICAFLWDLETNLASGLLEGARTLVQYVPFLIAGIPFAIPHELSDFVFGATLAPIAILYLRRYSGKLESKERIALKATQQG